MDFSSSAFALTSRYPPTTFTNIKDLAGLVASKAEELSRHDDVYQYISLNHITEQDFGYIEKKRHHLGVVRFSYYPDIGTLIIKVPARKQEKAHASFGMRLSFKVWNMGVEILELSALGATKHIALGPTASSSKESDSSWTNDLIRPGGWPFLVIEAGVSESMPRLQTDAAWWIANSGGQVKLVLLIQVTKGSKVIEMEKYVPGQEMTAPAGAQPVFQQPRKVAAVTVNQGVDPPTVQGAPLLLEFESVFGRDLSRPLEQDIVFTETDFLEWSRQVFL